MVTSTKKLTLPEIELTRGLAILAVVLIHITGYPLRVFEPGTAGYIFYTLINRGMQFAVPLFLLISALVLAFQMANKQEVNWLSFYQKRWNRAVVPFIIWTTLYLLVRIFVIGDVPYYTIKQGLLWYIFGKGFYHLYFLSVVIQLYFLFPLFHKLWKTLKPSFLTTLLIFASLQVAFYWANKLYIYQIFPYTGSLVFSYIFPIGLGLWLGYNTDRWTIWWKSLRPYLILTALLAGGFYINRYMAALNGVRISTFYIQMAWALYVAALGAGVIFLTKQLSLRDGKVALFLSGAFNLIGKLSYGIYLIHPFILLQWQKFFAVQKPLLVHLYVWIGFCAVVTLSGLVTYLLERTFLARYLFGITRKGVG